FEVAKNTQIQGDFTSITISGMGGSNLPGDVLRTYLELSEQDELEIIQNRNYKLPRKAFNKSLNFFVSYSGNTEETLASIEEAIQNHLPSVGFASGGRLEEICLKNNIPFVKIPGGIQPRCATGYFFSAMIQVLLNAKLIQEDPETIEKSAHELTALSDELEKSGKEISQKLFRKTPIIYTTDKYRALAMITKIKINENAKTPAFWNFFPELNHNEMVGFTLPQADFHVLTILDSKEHPQNIKRINITAELFQKKGIATTIFEIKGSKIFSRIFSTLILGDWISYYLALSYGQDPTPVEMVEDLKRRLQ
ncbi:MAG: bifunctional phosphoglucose/phosphomannose isomerase, partial [Patescibacteria group bacterium]